MQGFAFREHEPTAEEAEDHIKLFEDSAESAVGYKPSLKHLLHGTLLVASDVAALLSRYRG